VVDMASAGFCWPTDYFGPVLYGSSERLSSEFMGGCQGLGFEKPDLCNTPSGVGQSDVDTWVLLRQ
jgi:hypothetical protein